MVSVDTVLDLLSEKRRRYALYYLEQQEQPIPVTEVAKAVAEMEDDSTANGDLEGKYCHLEVELCHSHLPKVGSTEFIQYNADEGTVEMTDEPLTFDTLLTVAKVLERAE